MTFVWVVISMLVMLGWLWLENRSGGGPTSCP